MKPSRYNHLFQWKDQLYVVYNAASGAVMTLTPAAWRQLQRHDVAGLSSDTRAMLAEQGMLVPDREDERAAAMSRYWRARTSREKLVLTIAPTMDCNFACPYCFESRRPGIMSADTQDQVMAFVAGRLPHCTSVAVNWYGGEPLLAADLVLSMTRRIRSLVTEAAKSCTVSLITNGYRLDKRTATAMRDAGVHEVQITLDGGPAQHDARRRLRDGRGTFERILMNLHHVVALFDSVILRVNLDRQNADGWRQVADRLAKADLLEKVSVNLGKVDAISKVNEHYRCTCLDGDGFADQWVAWALDARRRGSGVATLPHMTVCSAVSDFSYVIGPEGHVFRCWNNPSDQEFAVGHVSEPALLDQETDWRSFDPTDWEACRECNLLPACMGGCPDMLKRMGPPHACNRLKHCLREAVILHTLQKLEGGSDEAGQVE